MDIRVPICYPLKGLCNWHSPGLCLCRLCFPGVQHVRRDIFAAQTSALAKHSDQPLAQHVTQKWRKPVWALDQPLPHVSRCSWHVPSALVTIVEWLMTHKQMASRSRKPWYCFVESSEYFFCITISSIQDAAGANLGTNRSFFSSMPCQPSMFPCQPQTNHTCPEKPLLVHRKKFYCFSRSYCQT